MADDEPAAKKARRNRWDASAEAPAPDPTAAATAAAAAAAADRRRGAAVLAEVVRAFLVVQAEVGAALGRRELFAARAVRVAAPALLLIALTGCDQGSPSASSTAPANEVASTDDTGATTTAPTRTTRC